MYTITIIINEEFLQQFIPAYTSSEADKPSITHNQPLLERKSQKHNNERWVIQFFIITLTIATSVVINKTMCLSPVIANSLSIKQK